MLMPDKEELQRLIELLSEYECERLLGAVRRVTSGERFWEDDISIHYNEYVKVRYLRPDGDAQSLIPGEPTVAETFFFPIPIIKSYVNTPRVTLPAPEHVSADLTTTLAQRRSRREYTGEHISLGQLSTILMNACGVMGFVPAYDYNRLPLRSFPSSGGLQAPEVYLSVHAVGDVPPGLYHYQPVDHALELLKDGNHSAELCEAALDQPFVETSALVFIITGYYERLRWKYGERAYRFMCMDAGFLSENIYLLAEAMGLGVCAIAGFVDDTFEKLLGVNGRDEMVLLLITVGVPQAAR